MYYYYYAVINTSHRSFMMHLAPPRTDAWHVTPDHVVNVILTLMRRRGAQHNENIKNNGIIFHPLEKARSS